MTERKDIPASKVMDAAQEPEAPDFYDYVTIKEVVTGESGIPRFRGTMKVNGEETWTSAPASNTELERFQQARPNRR